MILFPASGYRAGFDDVDLAAAAVGGGIVQFMIAHQNEVFNAIRFDLTTRQTALSAKCSRIRQLQEDLTVINNVSHALFDAFHCY